MTPFNLNRLVVAVAVAAVAILALGGAAMASGPGHNKGMGMNPCAAAPKGMNPCGAGGMNSGKGMGMNPCAVKPRGMNPCGAGGMNSGKGMGMNPCAVKPRGMNPCGAGGMKPGHNKAKGMNPCAAKPQGVNPCASQSGISPKLFTRPAGTMLAKGNSADLIKEGKKLFMDKSLSTNGNSCNVCHANFGMFSETFAKPFPHKVEMAEDIGKKQIRLDEMVQLCLLAPMEAKTLPWDSRKLAALTAYVGEVQKSFMTRGRSMNPCAAKPKGMNPCGG